MAGYIAIESDNDYSINIGKSFDRFQQEKKFWDFKVIVGDETLYCHSVILSSLSPVIEEMIETKLKEGSEKEITFENIKPEVMRKIINYMYTGCVDIPRELLLEVVQVCDELKIEDLKERCIYRVPDILSPQTALGWMKYAHEHELLSIYDSCKRFVSDSFLEVTKEKEFIRLSLDELKSTVHEMNDVVSPDNLLMATLSWIHHDMKSREKALDYTLDYLELTECGTDFLSTSVKEHIEIVRSNPEFNKKVTGMLPPSKLSLVILGGAVIKPEGVMANTKALKLASETDFVNISQIPEDLLRSAPTICLYDWNNLILTGGEKTDMCVMLDMSTKKWKEMTSLRSHRSNHAAVCIMQQLFVFGGDGSATASREWMASVDGLNVEEEQGEWQSAPPMPTVLRYPKVTNMEADVYLMGHNSPALCVFDASKQEWSQKTDMPEDPGRGFSLASGNGNLYAAGSEMKFCWQYKTSTDSWAKLSSPALVHQCGPLIFHHSSLFLLGGITRNSEEYATEEDKWVVAPYKLPEKLTLHSAFMMYLGE